MGKRLDKLGTYDSFTAPWETEAGSDAEIDKSKLKRLIFNLKKTEAETLDAAEESEEAFKALEAERDKAVADLETASGPEAQKKIDKLEAQIANFKAAEKKREEEAAAAELRAEVLGDFAEKHPKAAKYVVGTTEEELEKSLAEIKADFGIEDGDEADEDEDEDAEPTVRTRPRSITNPADPENGKPGEKQIDFNAVADKIIAGNSPFH